MPNGESSILDGFRQGSIAAFEALFRLHQRAVYNWILHIVRNPAAAEDLTVETFWRIYRAHARYDPARGFEPWVRSIATHAAIDWLRAEPTVNELPADLSAPPTENPGISADIRRKTALAFGRLPPRLRIVAVLAFVEELPQKEIAEALGISLAAVKLRVFRALRLLRKDLQQQGITP